VAKQHHPKNPLPSNYLPPGGRKYKVSTGESLETIARANGISENELNKFNFATTMPEEINWYLQHRVGCKRETHDHLNWMFTNDASPGFIYLPPLPPGVTPPPPSVQPPSVGVAKPALAPIAATSAGPDTEYKYVIELPTRKVACPPTSPVLISFGGKITVKGTFKMAGSHSKVSVPINGDKVDVDLKLLKDKFGELKFKTGIKPGKLSKLGLEWTPNNIPISLEFAANADLSKLISVSAKWKDAIRLVDLRLTEHMTFSGTAEPQFDFYFSPNPNWVGWRAAGRAAMQGARVAIEAGANAVRGIFIEEAAGTLTTIGVASVAIGVAAAFIGWVAFGVYEIGKAHHDGRILGIKYAFASGYASELADLTSDSPSTGTARAQQLLEIDWEASMRLYLDVYGEHDPGRLLLPGDQINTCGRAAVAQDVVDFVEKNGLPAWDAIRKKHQQLYGTSVTYRRDIYFRMLMLQIHSGATRIAIPILK
jgi:hypothetical protein